MEIFSTELLKYLVRPIQEFRDYWRHYGRQIPASLKDYTTFFVNNEKDLAQVYQIRDSIFGKNELSGNTYDDLIKKNKQGIKLLSKMGSKKCLAYHSIIPISKATYERFIANEMSHKEIILESLDWDEIGDELYLYITGVVVRKGVWNPSIIGYYILTDMVAFLQTVLEYYPVKKIGGIAGYPSTVEGLKLFENKTDAFEYTGKNVEDKAIQKIFVSEGLDIQILKEYCDNIQRGTLAQRYKDNVRWRGRKRFIQTLLRVAQ